MKRGLKKRLEVDLDYDKIKKIYSGYSNIYDVLFKRFFYPRIRYAIESMKINRGDRVLDIGVGTGLSLLLYPYNCHVTGIDLSFEMLKKAKKKIEKFGLANIDLINMDAMNLFFDDNSFDKVFISHVVSVVPDPLKTMYEAKRVCKKGGDIVIVNHFQSNNKFIAKCEEMLNPICKKVGWRSDLSLDGIVNGSGLQVDRSYKLKKIDLWRIVFATNEK